MLGPCGFWSVEPSIGCYSLVKQTIIGLTDKSEINNLSMWLFVLTLISMANFRQLGTYLPYWLTCLECRGLILNPSPFHNLIELGPAN